MKLKTLSSLSALTLIALVIGQSSMADVLWPQHDGRNSPSPVSYGFDTAKVELHVFTTPICKCCQLMWQTTRQCSSRGNAAFLEALRTDPDGCKNPNYPCGTLDTLKQRYAESGQIKMTVHTLIWNPMLHFAAGAAICAEGRAAFNLDRLYGTTVTGGYTNYKELVLATLELSEDDMKACAPTIKKEMEKIYATSMTLARELGITAVPSFVIGDKQLVGPSSNEEIFKFIDDALATE